MSITNEDLEFINTISINDRLPNVYSPSFSDNIQINLSSLEISKPVFKILKDIDINTNIVIERIAPDEEFKFIDDFIVFAVHRNMYVISNYGRVYSLFTKKFLKFDIHYTSNRFIVPIRAFDFNKNKYCAKSFPVDMLVMLAFCPNSDHYRYNSIWHKDLNVQNNYILNLEWCTKKFNLWFNRYIIKQKLQDKESLPISMVYSICEDLASDKYSLSQIAQKYGISPQKVAAIRYGKYYTFVSDQFNFTYKPNRLEKEQVIEICKQVSAGKSANEISRDLNVSISSVNNIRNGVSYNDIIEEYNNSLGEFYDT